VKSLADGGTTVWPPRAVRQVGRVSPHRRGDRRSGCRSAAHSRSMQAGL